MRCVIVLALVWLASFAHADDVPFIAQFDLELAPDQTLPLSDKIRFELVSANSEEIAASLAAWQQITVQQIAGDRLLVSMTRQPVFAGEVVDQYTSSSFVIDLEEASTQNFVAGFAKEPGKPFHLDQLTAYVSSYIDQPTYIHGFHIASKVASQRSGDCTEFAVLTTALARSQGLAARLMIGTVILEEEGQVTAFGHAWTEVWHQDKWQIMDAALYRAEADKLFYLPAGKLANEGPGFGMALLSAGLLLPNKIIGLKSL